MNTDFGPHYVYLQRRATFCAAHRLYSSHLSPEENLALYQKCSWENGHGHNYVIWVTIKGLVDPKTGLVMNLIDLKEIVKRVIVKKFDHLHLNHDVPELHNIIPSVENLAILSWNLLFVELQDMLYEVKILETENNFAIYRGERPSLSV